MALLLLACKGGDNAADAGGEGGGGAGGATSTAAGAGGGGAWHKALWSKSFGGKTGNESGWVTGADAKGAVLAFGQYSYDASVDFGGGPLEPSGLYDTFLAKFDPDGAHVFSKRLSIASADSIYWTYAEMSPQGEVFASGSFPSAASLGGPDLAARLVKLDASGAFLWSWDYSKPFVSDINLGPVRAGSGGDVFIAGGYTLTPDLGTGPLPQGPGIFVARLDAGGNPLWAKPFPASFLAYVRAMDLGPGDEPIVTGSFSGTLDLGAGPVESTAGDTYVLKLDASGKPLWSKQLGPSTDPPLEDLLTSIVASPGGDIVIGGTKNDSFSTSVFLHLLDGGSGALKWSKTIGGGSTYVSLGGLDATPDGSFILCAGLSGSLDLGGGKPLEGPALLYAELSKDGEHVWSNDYGDGVSYDTCTLAVGGDGHVATVGSFAGKIALGDDVLTSKSGSDVFVAKLPR